MRSYLGTKVPYLQEASDDAPMDAYNIATKNFECISDPLPVASDTNLLHIERRSRYVEVSVLPRYLKAIAVAA